MSTTPEEPKKEPQADLVIRALTTYRMNLQAVRIFAQEIGGMVDERDRKIVDDFMKTITALVPDLTNAVSQEAPEGDVTLETRLNDTDTSRATESREEIEAELHRRLDRALEDPRKREAFYSATRAFVKRHPQQGEILRHGALVSLMSHFESLIADLIHAYYTLYPAALPSEERSLTLAELRMLGSIEEAQAHLVSQEVDALLRESLDRQLDYFSKRPKVDLALLKPYRPRIVEVDQRRNLYVHNRGKVNRRYLERVDPAIAKQWGAEEGKQLWSSDEYISGALDAAYLVGTALGQLCWRKWEATTAKVADQDMIEAVYDLLKEGQWQLAAELASLARKLSLADDESRKIVAINHAIALSELGKPDLMHMVLDEEDWSGCSLRFKAALHVLHEEEDEAFACLTRAVRAEEINSSELREWPLLRHLRQSDRFRTFFAEYFPDELTDTQGPPQLPPGEPEPPASPGEAAG